MARGQRRAYNRVAATAAAAISAEEADLQDVSIVETTPPTNAPAQLQIPRSAAAAGIRRQYSRVSASASTDDDCDKISTSSSSNTSTSSTEMKQLAPDDDGTRITLTILDFCHTKFKVSTNPSWTVLQLKQQGLAVHKVPVAQQRLIYRGKLLNDASTLKDSGIHEDDVIVHLFPKPRVVISNSNNANTNGDATASDDSGAVATANDDNNGARVPTIVLDAAEAERRSSILVLGSPDYLEAQNSVKLFSFMLLMISSIELLNLLAIALGVPQSNDANTTNLSGIPMNTEDDIFEPFDPQSSNNASQPADDSGTIDPNAPIQYEQWGWPNSVDLVISVVGFYVALIGIKASNENTMRLAKQYLWGTAAVGVAWWLFNYYMTIEIDETIEEEREQRDDDSFPPMSNKDIYNQALSVMVLPGLLWIMCCFRAFQFHFLLREAEEEAEARIQRDSDPTAAAATVHADSASAAALPLQHDEELALQNNAASLT